MGRSSGYNTIYGIHMIENCKIIYQDLDNARQDMGIFIDLLAR